LTDGIPVSNANCGRISVGDGMTGSLKNWVSENVISSLR
jgi:hypothetical protein